MFDVIVFANHFLFQQCVGIAYAWIKEINGGDEERMTFDKALDWFWSELPPEEKKEKEKAIDWWFSLDIEQDEDLKSIPDSSSHSNSESDLQLESDSESESDPELDETEEGDGDSSDAKTAKFRIDRHKVAKAFEKLLRYIGDMFDENQRTITSESQRKMSKDGGSSTTAATVGTATTTATRRK